MQVEVVVKHMQTNFGAWASGRSLSSFGVFVPFCLPSKQPKFSFRTIDYSHGEQNRIGSKIHASRG